MGATVGCFRPMGRKALILPINGSDAIPWEAPSLVYNVMIAHPGHVVVEVSKFIKKGQIEDMHYAEKLKPNKFYFLVPVDKEGKIRVGARVLRACLEM